MQGYAKVVSATPLGPKIVHLENTCGEAGIRVFQLAIERRFSPLPEHQNSNSEPETAFCPLTTSGQRLTLTLYAPNLGKAKAVLLEDRQVKHCHRMSC